MEKRGCYFIPISASWIWYVISCDLDTFSDSPEKVDEVGNIFAIWINWAKGESCKYSCFFGVFSTFSSLLTSYLLRVMLRFLVAISLIASFCIGTWETRIHNESASLHELGVFWGQFFRCMSFACRNFWLQLVLSVLSSKVVSRSWGTRRPAANALA